MICFTYWEYLTYKKILASKFCLRDDTKEVYDYGIKKKVNHPHDKIFRTILNDKEEVAKLINKTIDLDEKITKEEIEKYNTSYISKNFENQESDIVYKVKGKNVFFLIEHQTKIDYKMAKRILEYEMAIMNEAVKNNSFFSKNFKMPLVVPFVIYTGQGKWNATRTIKECSEEILGYRTMNLGEYNLIDINNYTEEELLKEESFLSKAMLFEKTKTNEELFEILEKITKEKIKESNKELLARIIAYIFKEKLGSKKTQELLKRLERKGGKDMILERIREENRILKREGRKEGRIEGRRKEKQTVARRMKKENLDIVLIKNVTGLSREEIEKL